MNSVPNCESIKLNSKMVRFSICYLVLLHMFNVDNKTQFCINSMGVNQE